MNIADIEKCIKLLNNSQRDEAIEFLIYCRNNEILKQNGKKTHKAVVLKKIIDDMKDSRPGLAKIQLTKDGKQFFIDGYMAILWKEHQPELDGLPIKPYKEGDTLDIRKFILEDYQCDWQDISNNDKILLKNLNKYIRYYKPNRHDICPVYIFGRYMDAEMLLRTIKIIGSNIEQYYYNARTSAILFKCEDNENITMTLLEKRISEQEKQDIINRTNEFINLLSE